VIAPRAGFFRQPQELGRGAEQLSTRCPPAQRKSASATDHSGRCAGHGSAENTAAARVFSQRQHGGKVCFQAYERGRLRPRMLASRRGRSLRGLLGACDKSGAISASRDHGLRPCLTPNRTTRNTKTWPSTPACGGSARTAYTAHSSCSRARKMALAPHIRVEGRISRINTAKTTGRAPTRGPAHPREHPPPAVDFSEGGARRLHPSAHTPAVDPKHVMTSLNRENVHPPPMNDAFRATQFVRNSRSADPTGSMK